MFPMSISSDESDTHVLEYDTAVVSGPQITHDATCNLLGDISGVDVVEDDKPVSKFSIAMSDEDIFFVADDLNGLGEADDIVQNTLDQNKKEIIERIEDLCILGREIIKRIKEIREKLIRFPCDDEEEHRYLDMLRGIKEQIVDAKRKLI